MNDDVIKLLDTAESGNLLTLLSFNLTTIEKSVLMMLYYYAKKRALKLTPNLSLRNDLDIEALKNRNKNENDKNLVEQGKKCDDCAEYIYNLFKNDLIDNFNATLFAYVLCKLNQFDDFFNFTLLYNVYIDYNFKAKDGKSMLHIASKNNNLKLVKFLIKNKVDINTQDLTKGTPLHYATKKYHYDIVDYLLKKKADPNLRNNDKKTPLHLCAPGHNGNIKLFEMLIKGGADINKKYKHKTLLYYAVEYNRHDTVEYLLKLGANRYMPSRLPSITKNLKEYEVPFTLAARQNYNDIDEQINNFKIILLLK